MNRLSTFQHNNLITGTHLAAEIQSSAAEMRTFVVIGAYLQNSSRSVKPSKFLNGDQESLKFWIRKYDVNKVSIENDEDITEKDLLNAVYLKDIQSIEQLENELEKYLQDFSLMDVAWKIDNPLP